MRLVAWHALNCRQSVFLAEGDHVDKGGGAIGVSVEFVFAIAIETAARACPEVAFAICAQLNNGFIVQPIRAGKDGDPPLMEPAKSASGAGLEVQFWRQGSL